MDDDREAGKRTTVVLFGRKVAAGAYFLFGLAGAILTEWLWIDKGIYMVIPLVYLGMHFSTWKKIIRSTGAALNPLLGATARNLLIYALLLLAVSIFGCV